MKGYVRHASVALALTLAGCSRSLEMLPGAGQAAPAAAADSAAQPSVYQNGKAPANWVYFNDISSFSWQDNSAVAAGSDGNIWLANATTAYGTAGGGLLRVSMTGGMTLFPLTYDCGGVTKCVFDVGTGIAVGADGKFYLGAANFGPRSKFLVGVATTAGVLTVYDIPSGDQVEYGGYALGPDKNVWFAEDKHIAKITPAGKITEYLYPSEPRTGAINSGGGVTAGPDGNVWFVENGAGLIGKIVPQTGKITEYPMTSVPSCSQPSGIVGASDGNLYVGCPSYTLVRVSTTGVMQAFNNVWELGSGLVRGPDGHPWFANLTSVGEFNPSTDSFTNYVYPSALPSDTTSTLALGPDHNLWVPEVGGIAVLVYDPLSVTPKSLPFAKVGGTITLTVKETGATAWIATSTVPAICSVKQSTPADTFVVTAAGVGSAKIKVEDRIGNFVYLPCAVK